MRAVLLPHSSWGIAGTPFMSTVERRMALGKLSGHLACHSRPRIKTVDSRWLPFVTVVEYVAHYSKHGMQGFLVMACLDPAARYASRFI